MNSLVHIGNSDISVKEYNGQRVVTFKDIDMVHGRPDGTASRNFRTNKERFIEGEDFFKVSSDEIRRTNIFDIPDKATADYALITEQGYLMLVKSFTDDLAWDVQRQLVNGYFKARKLATEDLSPQTQLILQLAQSIANKELEDKERDRKIALANETARKAVETTENIKEAVKPIMDNWRVEIRAKIVKIALKANIGYAELQAEMHKELERRAGADLGKRVRNMKQRIENAGGTKKQIDIKKIDVIEQDKKLREIYSKIVQEYEVKYCA
jgi:hypothetical protein